ncbi:MAG TPA: PadR family transcriptional regulator [Solirubrobacteraceae bacterium]|jgi:DNA-binding PadR family transcriptional regulator|nr:PadR family transcriptional regulator [Solirubrobacteraceae bacterium]
MADLTPTGRVVLGMLALGRQTGYEIKQFVDKTTRNFWAASYGQIYPELKRLEHQGLVKGREEPTGERARKVYDLTAEGRRVLEQWLGSDDQLVYEDRDEGMLKLFFSDLLPERRAENIRAMREVHERKLASLRAIEEHARNGRPGPYMTLQLGMGVTEFVIKWCEEAERRLAEES